MERLRVAMKIKSLRGIGKESVRPNLRNAGKSGKFGAKFGSNQNSNLSPGVEAQRVRRSGPREQPPRAGPHPRCSSPTSLEPAPCAKSLNLAARPTSRLTARPTSQIDRARRTNWFAAHPTSQVDGARRADWLAARSTSQVDGAQRADWFAAQPIFREAPIGSGWSGSELLARWTQAVRWATIHNSPSWLVRSEVYRSQAH